MMWPPTKFQLPEQHAAASRSMSPVDQEKIRTALEAERVEVTDAYGNGQHVSIDVVSDMFEGQSSMKRQRMVYKVQSCRKSRQRL